MNERTVVLLAGLLVLAPLATADDLSPPAYRGHPNTTSAVWDFLTSDPTPLADGPAVGGLPPLPETRITSITTIGGASWMATHSGRNGVWPTDTLTFHIGDFPPANPLLRIDIQVTGIRTSSLDSLESTALLDGSTSGLGGGVALGDTWGHSVFYLPITDPNTTSINFNLGGSSYTDSLIVDTQSAPEPATLGLVLTGAIVTLLKRRRRT